MTTAEADRPADAVEEERFAPTDDPARSRRTNPWWGVHAARYELATRVVPKGARLLDVAAGSGYGLSVLRRVAGHVVGADVDVPALVASARAGSTVVAGAGERLPFATASFDAVTSFETIEHLVHREAFVAELARVLRPGGLLLLSTPNAIYTQPGPGGPSNPFHLHEYEPDELRDLIARNFDDVSMVGQVLSSRFPISPFQDDQRRFDRRLRTQVPLFAWRVMNKLPVGVREGISRTLFRRPFLPGELDYDFVPDVIDRAPVLVVTARRP